MKSRVKIHCGTPMVPTMMFSGAEFYCISCGSTQGLFGSAPSTPETPELLEESKENQERFKKVAADCIPMGCMFPDCEKCKHEQHLNHAGQEDLGKSDAAYNLLAGGILEEVTDATN